MNKSSLWAATKYKSTRTVVDKLLSQHIYNRLTISPVKSSKWLHTVRLYLDKSTIWRLEWRHIYSIYSEIQLWHISLNILPWHHVTQTCNVTHDITTEDTRVWLQG